MNEDSESGARAHPPLVRRALPTASRLEPSVGLYSITTVNININTIQYNIIMMHGETEMVATKTKKKERAASNKPLTPSAARLQDIEAQADDDDDDEEQKKWRDMERTIFTRIVQGTAGASIVFNIVAMAIEGGVTIGMGIIALIVGSLVIFFQFMIQDTDSTFFGGYSSCSCFVVSFRARQNMPPTQPFPRSPSFCLGLLQHSEWFKMSFDIPSMIFLWPIWNWQTIRQSWNRN